MATKNINKSNPTLEIELKSLSCYGGPIVGVDEAGRGPLAGPVVAAAVAYSENMDFKMYWLISRIRSA